MLVYRRPQTVGARIERHPATTPVVCWRARSRSRKEPLKVAVGSDRISIVAHTRRNGAAKNDTTNACRAP